MRYSRQKEEILNTVIESNNHPDAKEVYNLVKLKIPKISLGTVYRNLNILSNEGKIKKISMQNGNDIFDKTLKNHNHVICEYCGKVFDINLNLDDDMIKKVENEIGFKITNCNFNINGICKNCMKERKY